MKPDMILQSDILDILFEGRNKDYGAYSLRRDYNGRFLGRHLRVPEEVIEPGQRVKVPVRFIVNKDGHLSGVEFITTADEAFKKEILRVVAKMPRWTPGSQGGKTVSVYCMIPIIFEVPVE
ncbi:hypothetical protein HB364_08520 [Pseudoflavitalea sp. X16]|uniref:energy transducer TonB n=1 Tax=Paraflavitalea devenefica TaxID=2716334 RepID=UPI0014243A55|nr:energy transducer TonB [Paraflavitalea devenefica]NII25120.1 hypothetical protein [Paraflavitalea devenefica]